MQRSFDDLGTPLHDVTFVVLDLETTGGSPDACAITEVGAVKFRGGECLGTFQTLVNPGAIIPPEIVYLTGITQEMVTPAPRIESVLPALLEFIADAVIVGHNVRFDMGFLQKNLSRLGYGRLRNKVVDTCSLARRLVRDEVPNCALDTLSRYFRTATRPTHRALDDAQATAELLHTLLGRAGTLGVLALDDLLALPTTAAHPQVAKLRWVASLPRSPGVYVFRDAAGRALYVGKAVDLRRRVRTYFQGDDRRKIGALLREAAAVDHVVCAHELHASVLEVRMIQELRPRYNSKDKNPARGAYVKLTCNEPFPRLSIVQSHRNDDGCVYLGPLPSKRFATDVVDALQAAVPLRRCTLRPATANRDGACAPAQLGVATCPCSGSIDEAAYREITELVVEAMTVDASAVLDSLQAKMRACAEAGRFEDAAVVRNRAAALVRAIERQRRIEAVVAAGRLVIEIDGGGGAIVEGGALVSAWPAGSPAPPPELGLWPTTDRLISKETAAEVLCIASWIERNWSHVHVVSADNEFVFPRGRLATFEPRRRSPAARSAA